LASICYADTLFTTEKMLKDKPELAANGPTATLKGWGGRHCETAA